MQALTRRQHDPGIALPLDRESASSAVADESEGGDHSEDKAPDVRPVGDASVHLRPQAADAIEELHDEPDTEHDLARRARGMKPSTSVRTRALG